MFAAIGCRHFYLLRVIIYGFKCTRVQSRASRSLVLSYRVSECGLRLSGQGSKWEYLYDNVCLIEYDEEDRLIS
jgi:hypothetical protein